MDYAVLANNDGSVDVIGAKKEPLHVVIKLICPK
jgi:hypothetical protein